MRISIRIQGIFLLLACASPLAAQAGVGAAGGHATSEAVSFSYSVGQVFNNVISNSEYSVSHGIQHPLLLVISETPEQAAETAGIKIYPNPAADALHIERQATEQERCRVQLMNMQGKLLIDKNFDASEFALPLETIAAGHYLLRISSGKSGTNTYKILKAK